MGVVVATEGKCFGGCATCEQQLNTKRIDFSCLDGGDALVGFG